MASKDERHPVVAGLTALAAVAVVVGLIFGVVALVASHVLHLGSTTASDSITGGASLYLPTPSPTPSDTAPLITLAPGPGAPTAAPSTTAAPTPSSSPTQASSSAAPKKQIVLTASSTSAGAMEQFTLSGTYTGGEGQTVRVQRKSAGGGWQDFGAPDMTVQGGLFAEPIETGQAGPNQFRVKDLATGLTSNAVTVTIG